jgi:hypothetical protein
MIGKGYSMWHSPETTLPNWLRLGFMMLVESKTVEWRFSPGTIRMLLVWY